MAINRCRSCGAQVDRHNDICPRCGVRSPAISNPLLPSGNGKIWGILVIVFVIVAGLLWVFHPWAWLSGSAGRLKPIVVLIYYSAVGSGLSSSKFSAMSIWLT